ncbi:MAG: NUDIX domain-containing protein [bacterium]
MECKTRRTDLLQASFPFGLGEVLPLEVLKNHHGEGHVAAVIYKKDGDKILVQIVKQRYVDKQQVPRILVKFPGGGIKPEKDANAFDALQRETLEEIGLRLCWSRLCGVLKITEKDQHIKYFVLVDGNGFSDNNRSDIVDPEILDYKWEDVANIFSCQPINFPDDNPGERKKFFHSKHLWPLVVLFSESRVRRLVSAVSQWLHYYPEACGELFREYLRK